MDDPQLMAPLAAFQGGRPPAPAWFLSALDRAPERAFLEVEGARVETLTWGPVGAPGLVLLHGGAAHADWWSFIAPFFADRFRVVAPTFSGMGRSEWREAYAFPQFAREARAAAKLNGAYEAGKPLFVGHSFGARVAACAAQDFGDEIAAAVLVDPPFFAPQNVKPPSPPRPTKAHRVYSTLGALVARFRLAPPQACANPFILDHIARHSARETLEPDGQKGWTLGFDPQFWTKLTRLDMTRQLREVRAPLALARGETSKLFTPADATYLMSLIPEGSPHIVLPEAEHHLMIDQPLAFVAMLRTLVESWPPARAG